MNASTLGIWTAIEVNLQARLGEGTQSNGQHFLLHMTRQMGLKLQSQVAGMDQVICQFSIIIYPEFLINGAPKGFFAASRSLRQFKVQNLIQGFKCVPKTTKISRPQLANYTIIFWAAEREPMKNMKAVLICFEAVLGLKINFFKCELSWVRLEGHELESLEDSRGAKWIVVFPLPWPPSMCECSRKKLTESNCWENGEEALH